MTKTELYILQCMTEGRKLLVGFWVATLLSEMPPTKRMSFGSAIIGLARKLVEPSFPEENFTFHSEVKVLNFQALLNEENSAAAFAQENEDTDEEDEDEEMDDAAEDDEDKDADDDEARSPTPD